LGFIEKPPKLIAVQAEGSDAIARFVNAGKFEYVPANTIADSISAGAPRNLYLAAEAVKNSNGSAITVSDYEIISAQKEIAVNFGILSEPSSAAAFAGYAKFISKNPAAVDENNLLLITGNGLKDIAALEKWNKKSG
jgi:threonine synthase